MAQFYTLLTDIGQAKLANAVALGGTIEISQLAVGDGGGSLPTPASGNTALVNELRRAPINTSTTDPDNPSWIVVEQILPPDIGGWTIREIGIIDAEGDLIGIGNYPETYKPLLSEGSSRTQTVRFVLEVSDTSAVTLKIDPSVVLATRQYVDQQDAAHAASHDHPAATTTAQGMVEKATVSESKNGTSDKFPDAAGVLEAIYQYGLGVNSVTGRYSNADELLSGGFYGITGEAIGAAGTTDGGLFVMPGRFDTKQLGWDIPGNLRMRGNDDPQDPDSEWSAWVDILHSGMFSGSSQSKSRSGFQKLPGGLIIQWGSPTVPGSNVTTINYPITFPNDVFAVIGTDTQGSPLSPGGYVASPLVYVSSRSSFQVVLDINSTNDNLFNWIAVGY